MLIALFTSFELGGDKKTKGAALTFVCCTFHPPCMILPTCFCSDRCTLFLRSILALCVYVIYVNPSITCTELGVATHANFVLDCSRQLNTQDRGTGEKNKQYIGAQDTNATKNYS
jgi:hypothetical protein